MTRYAYRLETKRIRETDFPYSAKEPLSSPAMVVDFAKSLQGADVEKMLVLYLNAKNKLVCIQVFIGTIDRSVIYPREIIKHAILSGALNVVLVHNHPSGDPTPSPEDKNLTRTLSEACKAVDMRVLDHVIIGEHGKYFSLTEAGLMS